MDSTYYNDGTDNQVAKKKKSSKNKLAAGLFGILLGGLGVHKFYLGNAIGILYILFCWTGIPEIIGLVEGIVYLTMTDEEFAAKYDK